jgi:hypothetical protein
MTTTIYQQVCNNDHNPEVRTWYYDDLGNRVDKKTGKFVILLTDPDCVELPTTDDPQILNEDYNDSIKISGS